MRIAMTGVSGNMGTEVLKQTFELPNIELIRIILSNKRRNISLAKKLKKQYSEKIDIIFGSIDSQDLCDKLVVNVDYVIHMAAVIPPLSDNYPEKSYVSNRLGTVAIVNAIKKQVPQPKFIHISTIAIYGHRDEKHPWGRVGDPLLVSPFDFYAKDKLYGERYVLEANLDEWLILRQTAMLHPKMFSDNVSDGLLFHTSLNAPLEWSTSRDSGLLIKEILKNDKENKVPQIWKQIYNIAGGYDSRYTGYDVLNVGFETIGGNVEKFFKPNYFPTRNFHGIWIADSEILNELFHYQHDKFVDYWHEIAKAHPILKLGKIIPKCLLDLFLFNRLRNHKNSPVNWVKHNKTAKVHAYFNGKEAAVNLPKKWNGVKLVVKNDFGNFDELRKIENATLLSHGYDESKSLAELTLEDLQKAAEFRGGKCLAETMPKNEYEKIKWQCSEGHIFESSVFTILKGGHWCPECTMPEAPVRWNFNQLAKKSPFYAQLWYDTHSNDENIVYYIDDNGKTQMKEEKV